MLRTVDSITRPAMNRLRILNLLILCGLIAVLSVSSAGATMAVPVSVGLNSYNDPWPSAQERWMDISNAQYGDWLTNGSPNGKYSYRTNPQVLLTYDRRPAQPYFIGHIDATGLKPNFAYQLKLLGKPVYGTRGMGTATSYIDFNGATHTVGTTPVNGDDWANEKVGYAGRWWDDNNQFAGTNLNDSYYLNYYRNPVSGGNTDVHTIYGYHFMGSFITDARGEAHIDFDGQYSYHIDWASWQSGIRDVLHGTYAVEGALNNGSYYGYGATAPSTEVTLWYEYEAARANPVRLPQGAYHCRFLLTEESFHSSGLGGYWKSVLATEDFDSQGRPDTDASNDVVFTIGSAPVAKSQSVTLVKNSPKTITLSGTDADGDALSFRITALPAHGKLYAGANTSAHLIAAGELPYPLTGNQVTYLPDGGYVGTDALNFIVNDGTTNSTTGKISLKVTNPPPTGSVTTPANNAVVRSSGLTTIQDNAVDNSGLGIKTVTLSLYCYIGSTPQFWNNGGWGSYGNSSALPVTLGMPSGNISPWRTTATLPAKLDPNIYTVRIQVTDKAGVVSSFIKSSFKVPVPPTATVATPANNAKLIPNGLTAINGSAADNSGLGIRQINLSLYHYVGSTPQFWNNGSWGSYGNSSLLPISMGAANGNITPWSCTAPLPTNLSSGKYTLRLQVTDKSGQSSGFIFSYFTVEATNSSSALRREVSLSSGSVQRSTQTAKLSFTGELNAAGATDIGHYSVLVNGQAAIIENAQYQSNCVTLTLSQGSFSTGDSVQIFWTGLKDSNGTAVTGQTAVLTAN